MYITKGQRADFPMEKPARWGYRMALFTASFRKNFKKDCTMFFWFQQDLYPTFEPCILVRYTILFHFCTIHFLLLHDACPTSLRLHSIFSDVSEKTLDIFKIISYVFGKISHVFWEISHVFLSHSDTLFLSHDKRLTLNHLPFLTL